MRHKAVHLVAAIAETIRFLALAFLAFGVGALYDSAVSSLLRYAAAPQLLFAAGFFFLWLDPRRYGQYRPLLLLGKAASIACFIPLAAALAGDPSAAALAFGPRGLGISLAFLVAAVDAASLAVLILGREALAPDEGTAGGPGPSEPRSPGRGPSSPSIPGQGPDEIERVEA